MYPVCDPQYASQSCLEFVPNDDDDDDDDNNNNNNNKSPLCRVFTIIYLKLTVLLGYIVLQLFCNYNLLYM
jgi:hypothetical protein